MTNQIEFLGESFSVAPKIGLMPLLRFAHFAQTGAGTGDMQALDAIYSVLKSAIADEEWARFEAYATETRAEAADLLGCVRDAIAVISTRPTQPPSVSSDGSSETEKSSSDGSSWPAYSERTSPIMEDPRVAGLTPINQAHLAVSGA